MLKLGLFMMPLHPPSRNLTEVLEENRELVKLADRLGFSEAWMGEHYTSTAEPVTSPMMFNASLIAETEQIKFGTGVISMAQQHPAVVGGQLALFDHLSKGRCIFGIGSGGLCSDWELFDKMDGKARTMAMVESIELIQEMWAAEGPIDHEGTYFKAKVTEKYIPELGVGCFIKPYTKPHPPIAVSLRSANSMTAKFAGQRGWIPISGNFVAAEDIATHWPIYAEGAASKDQPTDPSIWRVGRSVLVTESAAQAEDLLNDPDSTFGWYYTYLETLRLKAGDALEDPIDWEAARKRGVEFAKKAIIAGPKDQVVDELVDFSDTVGDFGTLLLTGHDMEGAVDMWHRSFTCIAEEIAPKLSDHMASKRSF